MCGLYDDWVSGVRSRVCNPVHLRPMTFDVPLLETTEYKPFKHAIAQPLRNGIEYGCLGQIRSPPFGHQESDA